MDLASSQQQPLLAQGVRIDRAGRIVVPANIRKALGIRGGQKLTISLDGDAIKLVTVDAALERTWSIAKRRGKGGVDSVVDDFIAERRAEAEEE